jgi:hypothetical protein
LGQGNGAGDNTSESTRITQIWWLSPLFHPAEFEEQMCRLVREYTGDGEFLAVHHPAEADAHDDAPDATALALIAASGGFVGDIVLL